MLFSILCFFIFQFAFSQDEGDVMMRNNKIETIDLNEDNLKITSSKLPILKTRIKSIKYVGQENDGELEILSSKESKLKSSISPQERNVNLKIFPNDSIHTRNETLE